MPYPRGNPTAKHDLVYNPDYLSCANLIETFGYSSDDALFAAVEKEAIVTNHVRKMGSAYTYDDSPSPALSRSLHIIGIMNASKSALGATLSDDENIPSFFHSCTVSVKLADEKNSSKISKEERSNSHAFASLLRSLKKEGAMAILGKDKYQRIGILVPTDDITLTGSYEPQDFAVSCYVCTSDDAQKYAVNFQHRSKRPISSISDDNDGVWKPPDVNVDTGFWQPPQSSPEISSNISRNESALWQPSQENALWQPVSKGNDWNNDNANKISNNKNSSDSTFHADSGAAAADRFYSGLTRTLDTRAESRLYHMRAFNGWVKATQIQELDPKTCKKVNSPLRILDLACGKGGDLGKWVLHPRGVQNYVGIDVARGSLVDAAIRARNMRQKLKRCTFTCADLGADVPGRLKTPKHKRMQKLSTWSLDKDQSNGDPEFKFLRGGGVSKDDKFDVVSIQFAIHYMMETKKRALRFFQTVSELLEIGGNLIVTTIDARIVVNHLMDMGLNLHFDDEDFDQENVVITVGAGACRIKFEPRIVQQIFETKFNDEVDIPENLFGLQYSFTLVEGSDHASGVGEAVDLPEWLIPIPVLKALGQQAGLEIEYAKNFHEFFRDRSDPTLHAAAHTSMYNMKVLNRNGSISVDEYEISGLYLALKFRKVRESTIQIDDVDNEEYSDDDEDNLAELDPTLKARLYPMALLKAKNSAGADVWATLSSDRKKSLTEIELRKLVPKS